MIEAIRPRIVRAAKSNADASATKFQFFQLNNINTSNYY
jgi:hypothetical protein